MIDILKTMGLATLMLCFFLVVYLVVDKQEIEECKKWQVQASEYADYYTLRWQVEQCKAHGITL